MMIFVALLTLFIFATGSHFNQCDCYSLSLVESTSSGDKSCYTYAVLGSPSIRSPCERNIDYFIISSAHGLECGIKLEDISGLIKNVSDTNSVVVPWEGNQDDTNVNGIRIAVKEINSPFTICFDSSQVYGVKNNSIIGFKGINGYNCTVQNTVPDFCGIPNNGPIAVDDEITTTESETTEIPVTINDSDPDGDDFSITHISNATEGGTLTVIQNVTGSVQYTSMPGKCDDITPATTYIETFNYSITNTKGISDTAQVTITVECNPELYIYIINGKYELLSPNSAKLSNSSKPVENTWIVMDIYQCDDFEYGSHNLYDSFDFVTNFIGDMAASQFMSNINDMDCRSVRIDDKTRLRCVTKSSSVIGLNLVSVNLNAISESIVCINNMDVFYTFSEKK
eukprot:112135_1